MQNFAVVATVFMGICTITLVMDSVQAFEKMDAEQKAQKEQTKREKAMQHWQQRYLLKRVLDDKYQAGSLHGGFLFFSGSIEGESGQKREVAFAYERVKGSAKFDRITWPFDETTISIIADSIPPYVVFEPQHEKDSSNISCARAPVRNTGRLFSAGRCHDYPRAVFYVHADSAKDSINLNFR